MQVDFPLFLQVIAGTVDHRSRGKTACAHIDHDVCEHRTSCKKRCFIIALQLPLLDRPRQLYQYLWNSTTCLHDVFNIGHRLWLRPFAPAAAVRRPAPLRITRRLTRLLQAYHSHANDEEPQRLPNRATHIHNVHLTPMDCCSRKTGPHKVERTVVQFARLTAQP